MRIFLKTWVALMIYAITAISWGLNIFSILPNVRWSLVALICFVIFGGIIIYGLFDRDRQIERLKQSKPSIKVTIEGFNLRVDNIGTSAKFKSNINIIKDSSDKLTGQRYSACWQKTADYKTEIQKDDYDSIIIAKPEKGLFISSTTHLLTIYEVIPYPTN